MAAPLPPPVPKHILVKNYLLRPLTLTSGNTGYGTVGAGIAGILLYGSVTITLPGSATGLTYVMQPYQYSDGSPVPNDLTGATATFGTDSSYELDVTSVIAGQQYIAFGLFNTSGGDVGVAIVQGGVVQCLGTSPSTTGGVNWGYYRLTSTTEVRLYTAGSHCTGYSVGWSSATLSTAGQNSGYIGLGVSFPIVAVASVTVTPSSATVSVGRTQPLTATPKDASGNVLMTHPIAWSSSSASIATVSASGLVTAVAVGSATISATSLGQSAAATITVTPVVVTPGVDHVQVCEGATSKFTCDITYISVGQADNLRAYAYNAANGDISASCSFVWSATVPTAVSIVPSTDSTARDALITKLTSAATTVIASCGGKTGLFSFRSGF